MPVKKTTTAATTKTPVKKTTTRAKKTPVKAATTNQVAANARHIQENASDIKNNSSMIHILYGTIIVLMMIIAGLAFYVGQMMGNKATPTTVTPTVVTAEDISVTIIDDVRCSDCQASAIMEQLQVLPFLAGAEFIKQDFSDSWVSEYLEENQITALPAVIFNSNAMNDGRQITPYLTALPGGEFSLALGATFDPFAIRSDKGFLVLDEWILEDIKADAHFIGDENAAVTWLEYTDVDCHYCKKMETDGTAETVLEAIGSDLNKTSSHFIGVGGQASQDAAEALECIASVGSADAYNSGLSEALISGDNSVATLIANATASWVNETLLNACIDNGDSKATVERKFNRGQNAFGITGTPGNVIINNQTGEYEIISGAYPASTFEEVVTRMLAE